MAVTSLKETRQISGKMTIRHAGSLTPMCANIHNEFKRLYPAVEIVDMAGGAVMMAREMAKSLDSDIYASVDYSNIPNLLIPELADWYFIFASDGFVLRYTDNSKYASEINASNWIDIIQREDVDFWRGDPEGDPASYRTLMVLQLAEKYYKRPGLYDRLVAKSAKHVSSTISISERLAARDKGYAFSYRSHLMGGKYLNLPDQINLSNSAYDDYYRQVNVTIQSLKPGIPLIIRGESIRIGVTVPKCCTNKEAAAAWIHLLLSSNGRKLTEQAGKNPFKPVFAGNPATLPEELKEYLK